MSKTLVVGASNNPSRYSYIATQRLLEYGHEVLLYGLKKDSISGIPISSEWPTEPVDTITLYVGPANQPPLYDHIIKSHPRRVIFNPGTENPELIKLCKDNGIEPVIACTLVMLATGEY